MPFGSFNTKDIEIVSKETVFQGFFRMISIKLRHRLFKGGWSSTIERELFDKGVVSASDSAEAVCAIAYDPVLDVIGLVEQFRIGMLDAPLGPWSLECVAGMMDKGESVEAVIRRELVEEAGVLEVELLPITGFFPTPGSCNEFAHLFCAICDLSSAGGVFGLAEEDEDILFTVSPAQEVFDAMLIGSRMNNAATLIGLLWLQLNRSGLQKKYAKEVGEI